MYKMGRWLSIRSFLSIPRLQVSTSSSSARISSTNYRNMAEKRCNKVRSIVCSKKSSGKEQRKDGSCIFNMTVANSATFEALKDENKAACKVALCVCYKSSVSVRSECLFVRSLSSAAGEKRTFGFPPRSHSHPRPSAAHIITEQTENVKFHTTRPEPWRENSIKSQNR